MKDGKFEAKDFDEVVIQDDDFGRHLKESESAQIVNWANAILPQLREQWLAELLRDAPTVYLNRRNTAPKVYAKYWTEYEHDLTLDGPATHTARLIDIREIGAEK